MSDTGGTMEVAREYWGVRMARRGYDANKDLNDPDGWGRWYQGQLQKTAEARGLHWEVAASKVYDVPRGMTWPNVQKQLDRDHCRHAATAGHGSRSRVHALSERKIQRRQPRPADV